MHAAPQADGMAELEPTGYQQHADTSRRQIAQHVFQDSSGAQVEDDESKSEDQLIANQDNPSGLIVPGNADRATKAEANRE